MEIDGDEVRLEQGTATGATFGGYSANRYTLQDRVARGDLDDDGDDDAVIHIVEETSGTGVFNWIIAVIDDDGVPVAGEPVLVGDRVVVDGISVRDGLIEVVLLDRGDDEAFTVISRRSVLEIDPSPALGMPQVTVIATSPLTDEPLPGDSSDAPPTTVPEPTPTVYPPPPVTPPAGGDVMYLTFDDGPHPTYTPQVLDVLARYDARSTFFVLGSLAAAYPGLIRRMADEGHTIGNHTWNHENLAGLPREAFDETVGRTQAVLADLASPCLRPPYGSVDAFTVDWAESHGLSIMVWNVDPEDWRPPPAETIADHIVEWARPGAVVLLHDGGGDRTETVRGLEMALERLAGRGLRYEPVCR